MRNGARISVVLLSLLTVSTAGGAGSFDGKPPEGKETAADSHWAFEPVSDPAPPETDSAWVRSRIDRFVLARLETEGLAPANAADGTTWIRRVTIDLTGLPPTPQEVDSFLDDDSLDAREKVVDRLLASPRHGERWARHWLDVARYADTKGYVFTAERRFPYAFTYRDYVVRSLNEDLPYDRFVVEQIAADRLDLHDDPRPLAAMGFLTLGRRFLNNQHDIIDDRIDVVTRGLLALTVQCARCHDHKYDPIPLEDYYSLYGVFASSVEPSELPKIGAPEDADAYERFQDEIAKRQKSVDEYREKAHREIVGEIRETTPKYLVALATAAQEPPKDFGVPTGKGKIRPQVLARWRRYLSRRAKPEDAVFGPWQAFLADRDNVEQRARKLIGTWNDAAGGVVTNRLVREAITKTPPKSTLDVARVYSRLFSSVAKATARDDAERELREVLFADDSPVEVPIDEVSKLFNRAMRDRLRELTRKVDKVHVEHAGAPARAMALADASKPYDPRVFLRGKPSSPGDSVPRRFLGLLAGKNRKPFTDGSGRLELARAIIDERNPLTARVVVNRLWMHHIGEGLVRTPSDFGRRSDPPTHPLLLDWLASRLIQEGWSLKAMHRRIVLSSTYAQSSVVDARKKESDPENRLLWRANPRRIEFEVLRDTLLQAAGTLDARIGGKAVPLYGGADSRRRTLYGFIDRQNLPPTLRTFDFASPDTSTPRRHRTTVPQQALWLMNSAFAREQAKRLVGSGGIREVTEPRERIIRVYRRLLARKPDADELAGGEAFVAANPSERTWAAYVQTLFFANELVFVD